MEKRLGAHSSEADDTSESGADPGASDVPDQRVGIFYSAAAEDGQTYAMEFMAIFKAIGWDVTGPEASQDIAGDSGGLAFVVGEGGWLPACAEALRDALRIYEIEVGTRTEKGRELRRMGLFFGLVRGVRISETLGG